MSATKRLVRDAGYEALWTLGMFLAVASRPTHRTLDDVWSWYCESSARRLRLRRLEERGLVKSETRDGRWVATVTELGYATFCGGRDPEAAWNREWDGMWRILTFDLPRKAHPARMKFGRWLESNHFGRIQGSVWIHPDPVPEIGDVIGKEIIHPSKMTVFEGGLAGGLHPREISEAAWDFGSINAAYRRYLVLSKDIGTPETQKIPNLLREERQCWWEAVRHDPLLPKPLLPKGYLGREAWNSRRKLLERLHRNFTRDIPKS